MSTVTRQYQRRDTALNWSAKNPVLGSGEIGIELDTRMLKLGDGSTSWSDLPYYGGPSNVTIIVGDIFDSFLLAGM
jgi:hypothetical protein